MARTSRSRLQIELPERLQNLLRLLGHRMGSSGDADTTRNALDIIENIVQQIQHGYKFVVVPAEDEHPDAIPQLTRALCPESTYLHLIRRPHPWRRQLSFKGRRLTVGQFLDIMRTEQWSLEQAAEEFELPLEAAYEAADYGMKFASLLAEENAEDARAAKRLTLAPAAG